MGEKCSIYRRDVGCLEIHNLFIRRSISFRLGGEILLKVNKYRTIWRLLGIDCFDDKAKQIVSF